MSHVNILKLGYMTHASVAKKCLCPQSIFRKRPGGKAMWPCRFWDRLATFKTEPCDPATSIGDSRMVEDLK